MCVWGSIINPPPPSFVVDAEMWEDDDWWTGASVNDRFHKETLLIFAQRPGTTRPPFPSDRRWKVTHFENISVRLLNTDVPIWKGSIFVANITFTCSGLINQNSDIPGSEVLMLFRKVKPTHPSLISDPNLWQWVGKFAEIEVASNVLTYFDALPVACFKCSNVQTFKCSNIQMFKCLNVQMFKCWPSLTPSWSWFTCFKCCCCCLFTLWSVKGSEEEVQR